MSLGIVTDSTCDLPAATLGRLRVEAVPLRLHIGDEIYLDWRDIDPATLYDWMLDQGVLATVYPPEPEDFMHVYRRQLQRYDRVVSIHLSAAFSGTLEQARRAARRLGVEGQITFIDSGFAGPGLAEFVLEAAELVRAGAGAVDVFRMVSRLREEVYGVLSPSNGGWGGELDWLRSLREKRHLASGHRRLVEMEPGRVRQVGWARVGKVGAGLAAALRQRFGQQSLHIAISHAGSDPEALATLRASMEEGGLRIAHGRVQMVGPAMAARLGPTSSMVFARPAPVR
ncbi:MAG TPA: DegV family protein [Trueperaceae bacterium]